MTTKPDTWMPLYIAKYLADTGRLTTEGHGAYLLLIMDYWMQAGPLRDDNRLLASITRLPMQRWLKLRPIIESFFQIEDGLWHHKRIEAELSAARENMAARSAAGKAGASARWQTHSGRNADAKRTQWQNDAPIPKPFNKYQGSGGSAAREGGPLDTDAETGTFARLAAINRKRNKAGLPPLKDQKEIEAALSAAEGATG